MQQIWLISDELDDVVKVSTQFVIQPSSRMSYETQISMDQRKCNKYAAFSLIFWSIERCGVRKIWEVVLV